MRAVLSLGVTLAFFAAMLVAAPAPKPPTKKDLPLLGDWEPVTDGPAGPGGLQLTITFTPDGKLKYDQGRRDPEWGWYKIDPAKDPPQFDFATPAVANPMSKRKPYLGIYRLDGDVLTIHCAEGDRPTAFEAPAGSKFMTIRYRRVKKD